MRLEFDDLLEYDRALRFELQDLDELLENDCIGVDLENEDTIEEMLLLAVTDSNFNSFVDNYQSDILGLRSSPYVNMLSLNFLICSILRMDFLVYEDISNLILV